MVIVIVDQQEFAKEQKNLENVLVEETLLSVICILKKKKGNEMNTAEMWIKAQEDGMCYEATNKDGYDGSIIYQKDKGFFDEEGYQVVIETWNYPEDFMNEQWQLRTMTKSEAEAKFNIKIVGD